MNSDRGGFIALGVLVAAIFVLVFLYSRTQTEPAVSVEPAESEPKAISAIFSCPQGSSITAIFQDETVKLRLSDGRELSLPRAMSGSGARYANSDESFVFWNKGDTAFIIENGTTTYTDCVTAVANN